MSAAHDICFVGLKCYDLLVGAKMPRYLGGAEKQMVSLAKALAKTGMNISFITYDHGQPGKVASGGITIYKCFRPDEGLPGIRFIHPRMTKLWAAMRRVDARIYVQMGAGSETGVVALGARFFCDGKRIFLFCIASDSDCNAKLPRLPKIRERVLYKIGLRNANLIISQTAKQRSLINESFGLESEVLRMPCFSLPAQKAVVLDISKLQAPHILWIGRITEVKRLEWLLEIAKRCPEYTFDIIGAPNNESSYAKEMANRAEKVPNVVMHGKVSDQELENFYQKAALLCCTSTIEGFPTTFLEAWSYGLPVVTTFDPDGIVHRYCLGLTASSLEELVEGLKHLLTTEKLYRETSERALRYHLEHHTPDATASQFEYLIEGMIRKQLGASRGGQRGKISPI